MFQFFEDISIFGLRLFSASAPLSYLWPLEEQPNSPKDSSRYQAFATSLHRAPGKIFYIKSLNASLHFEFLDFFILAIGHKVTIDSTLKVYTHTNRHYTGVTWFISNSGDLTAVH